MKISFLMPAYNKEPYIAEAISSFLNQNYRDKELIIIDDHSTDGTETLCKFLAEKYKGIRYYRNAKNMGVSYCRNLARQYATGEIMCVLDADDIAYIQRAKMVNKYFTKIKDKDIIYGGAHLINVSGKILTTKEPQDFSIIQEKLVNDIVHSTVAFRSSVNVKYRENVGFLDDWYFYLDCYKAGYKFDKIDVIIGAYRLEPEGLTYKGGMITKKKEKLKEELRKEFADYDEDLTDIIEKSKTQKERIKSIIKDVSRETSVLDVGCNGGYLLKKLIQKGCSVIGLEKAKNLIHRCQLKGLDVRKWDLFNIQETCKFNYIILADILEHYNRKDVEKIVNNLYPLLEAKGKIIITVPYKSGNYSKKFVLDHLEDYGVDDFKAMFPNWSIESKPIIVDDYAIPYWEKVIIKK